MSPRDRNIILVAVPAAVAVIVMIFITVNKGTTVLWIGGAPSPPSVLKKEIPKGPPTREVAPLNVTVPGKDSTNVPAEVAVPNQVYAAGSANISQRVFSIKAEGGKFMPNEIHVYKGDTVDLSVTAVDGNYDFTQPDFGFKEQIPQGTAKRIAFQATAAGKFTFYCSICGGPSQGPVGYLVIAER